jgi:hypothetical protein
MTSDELNQFTKNLFWDADPDDLDLEKHKNYIVGRVLDYGEWNDWLFIRSYYGIEIIKDTATSIRSMFPKSLSFISVMTNTPEQQFRCFENVKKNVSNPFR